MRNEALHAYSLHQRPYQDKRSIYYLFTCEYGVIHGVAKKGIPQFVPLTLFASGKKSLKTLQQVTIAETVSGLLGQQQYAALYVNEITLKLLPVEDSMPSIYQQYAQTVQVLQSELTREELKLVLRQYEQVLLDELGFAIDCTQDNQQQAIKADSSYYFDPENGWIEKDGLSAYQQRPYLMGEMIVAMQSGISVTTLNAWSSVYRQLIDHLFDYKPLQSRILWQQFYRYQ